MSLNRDINFETECPHLISDVHGFLQFAQKNTNENIRILMQAFSGTESSIDDGIDIVNRIGTKFFVSNDVERVLNFIKQPRYEDEKGILHYYKKENK